MVRAVIPYVDLSKPAVRTVRKRDVSYPAWLTLGLWAGLTGGVEYPTGKAAVAYGPLARWGMDRLSKPDVVFNELAFLVECLRRRGNWRDVPRRFLVAAVELGLATEEETW